MAATTEFEFEDLLFAGQHGDGPSPRAGDRGMGLPARQEVERRALELPHRRQMSALSAAMCGESLQASSLDQPHEVPGEERADQTPVVPTSTAARRATIASLSETLPGDQSPNTKWSSLESSRPLRLGSSAPVCIPHSGHLRLRTHEGLSEVEEEEQDQPKATTFVPPHLMVDKPAIQFSLHGSTAEKKAKLRARNTILQMTGFLEPAKSEDKAWNHGTERAIKAPGALAREFGASKCEPLESEQG
eukprot:evm.model.scf_3112.1 EVM.evm.TU.scf_3112.1   scf_3112:1704-3432(+)